MSDLPPEAPEPDPEVEAIRRENAFLKAGVDVESPLGKLMLAGYDGPLEAEAIKGYHAQVAPTPEPAKVIDVPVSDAERDATRIREMIATGGAAPTDAATGPEDPHAEGLELALNGLKRGLREEEAIGGFINHIADAHMRGVSGLTTAERMADRGQRQPA